MRVDGTVASDDDGGRNGGGKSTLIKVIAGLEPVDSGRVSQIAGLRLGVLGQVDEAAADATVRWLERAVIGLNLCPFAKAAHVKAQVRIAVSDARDTAALANDLAAELALLRDADPARLDNTLLVHPHALRDFLDYNDFLAVAEALDAGLQPCGDRLALITNGGGPGAMAADFAADVIKVKGANADAVFVYLNEEESARFLREAKKQGLNKPLIGETTLLGQKVIELAGDAANGVKGHVGLTIDAPIPSVQEWSKKYEAKFKSKSDHNGLKGYFAPYMIKVAAEKAGKLDPKAIAATLHGLTITPAQEPNILMEATWNDTGDIDRISFLGEVKDGKQVITETLPKLGK